MRSPYTQGSYLPEQIVEQHSDPQLHQPMPSVKHKPQHRMLTHNIDTAPGTRLKGTVMFGFPAMERLVRDASVSREPCSITVMRLSVSRLLWK